MSNALSHRGPDSAGLWKDDSIGLAMAHRRLSIVDLSEAGQQPMTSASGRYTVVFNGEIYNHTELRRELHSVTSWRGTSDTETLLACFEQYGIASTLQKSSGMFAFALWDSKEQELILARDRFGEKPLYYFPGDHLFLFGSELKSLRKHPNFPLKVEHAALALYFQYGYIPDPFSIYESVFKLCPSSILRVNSSQDRFSYSISKYWSLCERVITSARALIHTTETEADNETLQLLTNAVKLQCEADVPVGAFLSGGVDSSLVSAILQQNSRVPIQTFSIGFNELRYDESRYAKNVANYLRTHHTTYMVSSAEAMSIIPRLHDIYDEPFGDASAIPTIILSKLARSQVTVCLTGDGADEIFGGYRQYYSNRLPLISAILKLPKWLRRSLNDILNRSAICKHQHSRLEQLLLADTELDLWNVQATQWHPNPVLRRRASPIAVSQPRWSFAAKLGLVQSMMLQDALTYLPGDILVKVDRASMSASLETRTPFLDHRLAEYAWSLPLKLKVSNGQGKIVLKRLLTRFLPKGLFDRPKQGFALPIDDWLRSDLRDWAANLLSHERICEEGYLDPDLIRNRWNDHISGRRNWRDSLWLALMWQQWLDANRP